jgi:hypothetical protein
MPRLASLAVLPVLLAPALAGADILPSEPPPPPPPVEHGYVGGGPSLTVDQSFMNVAFAFEGALKLPDVPLWVRAEGDLGTTGDFEGFGPFRRGRVGLETRTGGPGLCALFGLEAGYETQVWKATDEETEHHHGAIVTGRVGLDAGGSNLRFRLVLELSRYHHVSDVLPTEWTGGGGLVMTLVYRL